MVMPTNAAAKAPSTYHSTLVIPIQFHADAGQVSFDLLDIIGKCLGRLRGMMFLVHAPCLSFTWIIGVLVARKSQQHSIADELTQ